MTFEDHVRVVTSSPIPKTNTATSNVIPLLRWVLAHVYEIWNTESGLDSGVSRHRSRRVAFCPEAVRKARMRASLEADLSFASHSYPLSHCVALLFFNFQYAQRPSFVSTIPLLQPSSSAHLVTWFFKVGLDRPQALLVAVELWASVAHLVCYLFPVPCLTCLHPPFMTVNLEEYYKKVSA
ncbi:hypothetical protein CVT26_003603 [Gymnopilus dilepis]|uniref:Uncharacterized protein n=1 Tax=Gymnopilus dilepis TaxID=231916 RepID=A0A409W1V0_9AGAR|nr:hypothetical protein CVT26_003603 [Gymnopilus dilepis]